MTYENLLIQKEEAIAILQIHRPKVRNALNALLMKELTVALEELDRDEAIRCLILTGDENAFAAGADIREMVESNPIEMFQKNTVSLWENVQNVSKPVIAAVSGYALGGGCELAMCCDMIVASENARFGQPEIQLGVIPGAGGTQRLTRALGKYRAMELVLTGRTLTAREAERWGLVNRVVPDGQCLDEARRIAVEISRHAPLAVKLAKEAILKAEESSLAEGIAFERKNFFLLFSSEDQREGMKAFLDKRKPEFKGK
ncbi:MAG: enoyl-CoA hydratase-related protein [Terriglobia bacterium]